MTRVIIIGAIAVIAIIRVSMRMRKRRQQADQAAMVAGEEAESAGKATTSPASTGLTVTTTSSHRAANFGARFGDVGIIAMREITERVRGRIFRVGTLIILLAVGLAIIIPNLNHHSGGSGATAQEVGVVGSLSPEFQMVVVEAGKADKDDVHFVTESSLDQAKHNLRDNSLAFAIVNGDTLLLNEPASDSSSPADPTLVQNVAEYFGLLHSYQSAGLTPTQIHSVTNAQSIPVHLLSQGQKKKVN